MQAMKIRLDVCLMSVVRSVDSFIHRRYSTTQKSFINVINWLGRKTFINFCSCIHFFKDRTFVKYARTD